MMNDTIYRQAAIDAVRHSPIIEVQPAYMLIDKADVLKNLVMLSPAGVLPSAQRTGRWIFETLDGIPGYRPTVMFCSKCGRVSIADYNYCPNCGAKMKIEEQKQEKQE